MFLLAVSYRTRETIRMFLDEATITVEAGQGGRGCVAWRREKYVAKGGPNGGNGGAGGDVFILADENTDTLSDFASRKKFVAERGEYGLGSSCAGKAGEDLILHVPPGTIIYELNEDGTSHVFGDLTAHGDRIRIARGGCGGYGNEHFKSSTRQRPDFAELGEPGETRNLKLELKLVADLGIIGYPSVGKSTLISVISAARPKIGDYPFTTLIPNLGVVQIHDRAYVVCDVPGLIEGASEGKGLGHAFLRHIERCGALVHLLDLSRALVEGGGIDPALLIADYRAIRHELSAYSSVLAAKRELVVLNKIDLTIDDLAPIEQALREEGIELFHKISSVTQNGTEELKSKLLPIVLEERTKRLEAVEEMPDDLPVLQPHLTSEKMGAYRVAEAVDGSLLITGRRLEQFTSMTNFESIGAVERFKDVLERIGLRKTIAKMNAGQNAVYIGSTRIDSYL